MEKLTLKVSKLLSNLKTIDYRKLTPLQGDLKELSEKNKQKILNSFEKKGFFAPLYVWKHKGINYILDGHQRTTVLNEYNAEPYELPYVEIEAANRKDAKERLLAISSQYGKATAKGLDSFLSEDDLDLDFVFDTTFEDLLNDNGFETEGIGRASFADDSNNSFAFDSASYAAPESQGSYRGDAEPNYSNKNKEIDVNEFSSEMLLKLFFSQGDYKRVCDKLKENGNTFEEGLLNILFNGK
jgi:hypothetical protein